MLEMGPSCASLETGQWSPVTHQLPGKNVYSHSIWLTLIAEWLLAVAKWNWCHGDMEDDKLSTKAQQLIVKQ